MKFKPVFVLACGASLLSALATPAKAQYQAPASSYSAGGSCTGSNFVWPDSNGHILHCVSSLWVDTESGGGLTGGTTNYVARWTGATSIGTGLLYDNTSAVGIGTASPQSLFHVYNGEVQVGSSSANCTGSNAGAMRYSSATTSMLYCNGSTWSPFKSAGCYGPPTYPVGATWTTPGGGYPVVVWGDGTYLYVGDTNGYVTALTFNASTHAWTSVAYTSFSGQVKSMTAEGSYIFVGTSSGLYAVTFNGSSFTSVATASGLANANALYWDGTYLYVGDPSNNYLYAYTFSGSAFTQVGSISYGLPYYIAKLGSTIFVYSVYGTLYAVSFNGSSFTQLASDYIPGGGALYSDGTYLYLGGSSVYALTFSGSTFTTVGSLAMSTQNYNSINKQGTSLYFGNNQGTDVFSFNGTTFTQKGSYLGGTYYGRTQSFTDSNYLYVADGYFRVGAYTLCP